MSKDTEYSFPFRRNYELSIAAIWMVIAICVFGCPYVLDVPARVYQVMGFVCALLGVFLGANGVELYIRKSRLKGYPLTFIDPNSDATLKMFHITDKEILKNVKKRR